MSAPPDTALAALCTGVAAALHGTVLPLQFSAASQALGPELATVVVGVMVPLALFVVTTGAKSMPAVLAVSVQGVAVPAAVCSANSGNTVGDIALYHVVNAATMALIDVDGTVKTAVFKPYDIEIVSLTIQVPAKA
jgi:hypothetical protein